MKKVIFLLYFLIIGAIALAQPLANKYKNLIKKADTYYRLKNYKASVLSYSKAFQLDHLQISMDDRYNAACSWALEGTSDSAFYQLNYIATIDNYYNIEQITTDHDLISLRKGKRWKALLETIQQNKEKEDAKLNQSLIKELDSIRVEFSKYRGKMNDTVVEYGYDSQEMRDLEKTIVKMDSINLIRVEFILDTYGWPGPEVIGVEGDTTLFLVIQHSNQKTQEKYLSMMQEAAKQGRIGPDQVARLEDRVAIRQGKKQIYGTQVTNDATGRSVFYPIEDINNVNIRRDSVGLEPLEEYAQQFGIVLKAKSSEKDKKPKLTNVDFATAIEIQDSIIGPVNVSKGYGSKMEYRFLACGEENSAWFKFKIDFDTLLTFDIVPEDEGDDYDFIIFKCNQPECIKDIMENKTTPSRMCFSVNYGKSGSTGLSEFSESKAVGAGPGIGYASAISVKAGDTFYLVVNFPEIYHRTSKGFKIYFYNYWPKKPKELMVKRSWPRVMENVIFETDKSVLLESSFVSLNKILKELQENKNLKIEIRGHTDNIGPEFKNQKLSEQRAKAVMDYFVSKNIDKNRLTYTGFGSSKPITGNDTVEGRSKNRRVEFIIQSAN